MVGNIKRGQIVKELKLRSNLNYTNRGPELEIIFDGEGTKSLNEKQIIKLLEEIFLQKEDWEVENIIARIR